MLDKIRTISGEVRLPGSKSLSNRILLASALAEGTTRVENLLRSEVRPRPLPDLPSRRHRRPEKALTDGRTSSTCWRRWTRWA